MTTKTESTHAGEFLVAELPNNLSRRSGVLNSGQNCVAGTVLGRLLTLGAATFVGTVGTRGTVTVAATVGPKAQIGTYKLVCVGAASNAGTFQLRAPDGSQVPFDTASVITVAGGAFTSDHLGITIADGATDFSVGDTYTIAVSGGDYSILAPAGTDGTQIAAGILFAGVDASSADTACVVVEKTAAAVSGSITWPGGITDAQKSAATAQLEARGIVLR